MQYKIGQTLILKHETEIETVLGRKIKCQPEIKSLSELIKWLITSQME